MPFVMELLDSLVEAETAGWQAIVDGAGRQWFRDRVDDQIVVLGPRFGVASGLAALDQLAGATWSWFRVRAPQVVAITEDVATLTYRVIARRDFDSEYQAVVSSTYRRDGAGWLLVVRQETPM